MIRNFTLRKSFVYFFAAFCLISCEKDDDFFEKNVVNNHDDFEISSHFAKEKPLSIEVQNSIIQSKNISKSIAKSIYDSISGLYIDDSKYNHLKADDYESFTFNIIDNSDSLTIKYLVLATKKDSLQKIYYQPYLATIPKTHYSLQEPSDVGDILSQNVRMVKFETAFMFSKTVEVDRSGNCLRVYNVDLVDACKGELNQSAECGDWTNTGWVARKVKKRTLIASECNMNGGGGGLRSIDPSDGSFYDDQGNPNSNGGIGNQSGSDRFDPDGDTLFSPDDIICPMGAISDGNGGCLDGNPGSDNHLVNTDPDCESLKNLAKSAETDANITPIVQELVDKTTLDKEYSISYRKDFNFGQEYSNPDPDGIQVGSSLTESNAKTMGYWFGSIHSHPLGTYPMFSWTDIKLLLDTYEGLSLDKHRPDAFIMIVNPDGSVYAIKVSDIDVMNAQITAMLNFTPGDTESEKLDFLNRQIQFNYINDADNIEKVFLEEFGFFGFEVYKSNAADLTNWKRLGLIVDIFDEVAVEEYECN